MGLPIGAIILWKNSAASLPSGWQICNGTNGTPDLRDYFIYGAASDGDLSGTGTGVHSHTRDANTGSGGAHDHAGSSISVANTTNNITDGKDAGGSGVDRAAASHSHSGVSGALSSDAAHTHTVGGSTNDQTAIPPYIKLYYAMRVS